MSEVGSQRSEVRGQKSEVRGQKSEGRTGRRSVNVVGQDLTSDLGPPTSPISHLPPPISHLLPPDTSQNTLSLSPYPPASPAGAPDCRAFLVRMDRSARCA